MIQVSPYKTKRVQSELRYIPEDCGNLDDQIPNPF